MREPHVLNFAVVGTHARVACADSAIADLVRRNYSACLDTTSAADIDYEIGRDDSGFYLRRTDGAAGHAWGALDAAELIFLLEKDLILEAQVRRSDLYFLHAAAVAMHGRAMLLIGRSGSGKSTTCWGLLHHGCSYLSDELAPLDLRDFTVTPYPHAVCLKSEPDAPYSLPTTTLRTDTTLHVPAAALPCSVVAAQTPLQAIVHVQHIGTDQPPALSRLSAAQAGMLVYANALNPLCHPGDGLDAALEIASRYPVYSLTTGALDASIGTLLDAMAAWDTP